MSCVLRITGTKKFDLDKFQKNLDIKAYKVDRIGDPILKSRPDKGLNTVPGLAYEVSNADFDNLEKQIKDAIKFLTKYKTSLKYIKTNKTIKTSVLDFGINSRISKNIAGQFDRFPAQLLKLAGDLKIDIELSQYSFVHLNKRTPKLKK